MDTDRRGFFRIVGSVAAFLSGRAAAQPLVVAPEIHRGTRNTILGAVGRRRFWNRAVPPVNVYPGRAVVALPAARESERPLGEVLNGYTKARGFSAGSLSVDELATLLYHTNGITGPAPGGGALDQRRAAPSAGALYSGEVYVVAESVRGLEAGLYYYAVLQHQLVRLRGGQLLAEVGRALENPSELKNAAAAVVLTNVFGRYSRRYANRGYRYALIDSGHIGENFRLVARSNGLVDVSPQRFWDDALNELLGVDGQNEAVCALHVAGRSAADQKNRPLPSVRRFNEKQRVGTLKGGGSVPERFHEATKLQPGQELAASGVEGALSAAQPIEEAERMALPTPTPSAIGVETAIRRRRSAKVFDPPSVSLQDLSFVLQAAQGNPELERTAGVEVDVVAHSVVGVEPGIYRYQPSNHQLVVVQKGKLRDAMVEACLRQEKAGSAAVGFVMAASLDAARSPLGDRRYRDLLLESGAIAQRIYLAAEAVGLAARNLAAFMDDRFNGLLQLDRRGLFALHLTMLGHGD